MIGMVTPKVSRCDGGSKHGLESPQRHPKGTNLCVSPFANAQDPACGRIDVNVILKEAVWLGTSAQPSAKRSGSRGMRLSSTK